MTSPDLSPLFTLSSVGLTASARAQQDGFLVLAGSQARAEVTPSYQKYAPPGYRQFREDLIQSGRLVPSASSESLVFTEDVLFRGSTPAAVVILGRNADGTREWTWERPDGRSATQAEWLQGVTGAGSDSMPGWTPFFSALASRLLEFEARQPELVDVLRTAGVHIQHDEGEPLSVMDPFSFFSLLLKHQSDVRVLGLLGVVREQLGIEEPVPPNVTGVPWSNPMNAWFFPYRSRRTEEDLPTLWTLARQTVAGTLEAETFVRALEIRQVALPKLTQGLFWLNPDHFLALNSVNVPYLESRGVSGAGAVRTPDEYEAVLEAARPLAASFPVLSHQAWLAAQRSRGAVEMEGDAFPFQAFVDEAAGLTQDIPRGNTALDRRYAPLLLSLLSAVPELTLLRPERQPYTASKQLGVKVRLGRGSLSGESWSGLAFLFPTAAHEYRPLEPGLNLKVVFPDGRHEFIQDALLDDDLRERFAQVIVSGGTQPGLFALNPQFGHANAIPATPNTLDAVQSALHRYAQGKGRSTSLQVDQMLTADTLESEEFPDALSRAMQYLDRVAQVMDEIIRTGQARRAAAPEAPTIEVPGTPEPAVPEVFTPVPGVPLNQILYGPPGTGKTYRVVDEALSVLDPAFLLAHPGPEGRAQRKARYDVLVADGQVSFVTFHQSFGYEDFIEGIKPVMQGGQLSYRLEDGVFLNAVRAAGGNLGMALPDEAAAATAQSEVRTDGQVWRLYMDGTRSGSLIRERSVTRNEIRVGSWLGGSVTLDGRPPATASRPADLNALPEDQVNAQQYAFKESVRVGDMVLLATGQDRVGAVGVVTGEYRFDPHSDPVFSSDYAHARPVRWLATGLDVRAQDVTGKTFAQQTLQRVAGVSPAQVLDRLGLKDRAAQGRLRPHVLIIDEINRGNVSKIFGELITLLEGGKRAGASEGLSATLPLSRRTLSVPQSLYVVGTMNTADRSLTLLDAALRRRFVFRPVWPEPEVLPVLTLDEGAIDLRKFLFVINERIERLLSREQVIGHAYLLGLPATLGGVASAVRERILPLLEEYFFEDWNRIRTVLADDGKPEALQFVQVHRSGGEVRYRVNEAAFEELEAFTLVYSRLDESAFPFRS